MSPSRETTPLIRTDFCCSEIVKYNDNKLSLPQERPPLLSGHISDAMK
jgi:hypothetical protein